MLKQDKYSMTISVQDPKAEIEQIIRAELKNPISGRATYTMQHSDGITTFDASAKDASAFKMITSVLNKHFTVIEQMKNIQNE